MKVSQLVDKSLWAEDLEVGKIRDAVVDSADWKMTNLEVRLRKETGKEILGANSFRNLLSTSALKKETDCCSARGIELQVSKAQLRLCLKPP